MHFQFYFKYGLEVEKSCKIRIRSFRFDEDGCEDEEQSQEDGEDRKIRMVPSFTNVKNGRRLGGMDRGK